MSSCNFRLQQIIARIRYIAHTRAFQRVISSGFNHYYIQILHTPIYYFILLVLDSVSHGELIPIHLPSFRTFLKIQKNMKDCFVHFSFFYRNKQNSAALS